MSLALLNRDLVLNYKNVLFHGLSQHKKPIGMSLSVIIFAQNLWKLLRKLSLCGDSKNPVLKFLHNILKRFMNQGLLMKIEFYPSYPFGILVALKRRHALVNFGSYGTVPRKILEEQISLQRDFEMFPDVFYRTIRPKIYEESRVIVAQHIGCDPKNLVFVENIAHGMNPVLRSLFINLQPGDVVLYTSLVYLAVLKTIDSLSKLYNVQTTKIDITFPITSEDIFCNYFEEAFQKNPNIRIAIFDHISSVPPINFPVKKLAKLCKKYDIISVVDGAHAAGQVKLDIESLNVDIYIGNLHKWYYCPKSCGFLYVDPKYHEQMQPCVFAFGAYGGFHDRFKDQGTKSYTSYMVAGKATQYMDKIGGIDHVQSYVTPFVEWVVDLYTKEWGTKEWRLPESMKPPYMRTVFLPDVFNQYYDNADILILDMIAEYNLTMFFNYVQGRLATRISAQIFSTKGDYYYAASCIKHKAKQLQQRKTN